MPGYPIPTTPEPTIPPTTAPQTTMPPETAPPTTAPPTTAPEATSPPATAPATDAPSTTTEVAVIDPPVPTEPPRTTAPPYVPPSTYATTNTPLNCVDQRVHIGIPRDVAEQECLVSTCVEQLMAGGRFEEGAREVCARDPYAWSGTPPTTLGPIAVVDQPGTDVVHEYVVEQPASAPADELPATGAYDGVILAIAVTLTGIGATIVGLTRRA